MLDFTYVTITVIFIMSKTIPRQQRPAHHLPVRHPGKRLWQKVMTFIANFSFVMTGVGVVITLIYGNDVSAPLKAALGATTFFFFAVGIVLKTMGSTSIPDLTIAKDKVIERRPNQN